MDFGGILAADSLLFEYSGGLSESTCGAFRTQADFLSISIFSRVVIAASRCRCRVPPRGAGSVGNGCCLRWRCNSTCPLSKSPCFLVGLGESVEGDEGTSIGNACIDADGSRDSTPGTIALVDDE
jgi:hypothetical protein